MPVAPAGFDAGFVAPPAPFVARVWASARPRSWARRQDTARSSNRTGLRCVHAQSKFKFAVISSARRSHRRRSAAIALRSLAAHYLSIVDGPPHTHPRARAFSPLVVSPRNPRVDSSKLFHRSSAWRARHRRHSQGSPRISRPIPTEDASCAYVYALPEYVVPIPAGV